MKSTSRHFGFRAIDRSGQSLRRGFTLMELLIAVGILVALTAFTVGAFTAAEADRVGNSIGSFRNALEGARSRAIGSGQIHGIRLLMEPEFDPDNPINIVKSVAYIASAGDDVGSLRLEFSAAASRWQLINQSSGVWQALVDRDLLQSGNRIEIPADSGNWFTMQERVSDDVWRIREHYPNSSWFIPDGSHPSALVSTWRPDDFDNNELLSSPPSGYPMGLNSGVASRPISYRLELSPILDDGAEPILFDSQVCIDLAGSRVPAAWRGVEDSDGDLSFDSDINSNGQFDYAVFSSGVNMDILFGPDGAMTGVAKNSGVISFRFAHVSDVLMIQPVRTISTSDSFDDFTTYSQFMVPANPEKDHRALTIFPQTGAFVTTDINPTVDSESMSTPPGNGFNSQYAEQPFSFAFTGQESNK